MNELAPWQAFSLWLHQRQVRVQVFAGEQRDPADPRLALDGLRLRGVPIVGRASAGGAIPGTRPDVEIVRRERQSGARSSR